METFAHGEQDEISNLSIAIRDYLAGWNPMEQDVSMKTQGSYRRDPLLLVHTDGRHESSARNPSDNNFVPISYQSMPLVQATQLDLLPPAAKEPGSVPLLNTMMTASQPVTNPLSTGIQVG